MSANRKTAMGPLAYYVLLALCCLVGTFAVSAPIWLAGRGLVWMPDTLVQQVASLAYGGDMLRHAFASLAAGTGFDLDSVVYNLGYGDSMRATFSITDPLKWLAALFPQQYAEYALYVIVFLRVYLAAVLFSLYSFECGRAKGPTLVAALCYVFSGFAMFWGILRHPSFLNALIMLPFVLWGAERLFRGKSPAVFSISVAVALMLSTYYAYMVFIMLVIYCLIRYFVYGTEHSLRSFATIVGKFLLFGCLGVALAGIAVIPEVISLTSMDRVSKSWSVYVPTVYGLKFYGTFIARLVGTLGSESTGEYIGCVGTLALVVLVCCAGRFPKRQRRAWLVAAVVVLVFSFVPKLGSVMNGFNYTTDRWMFALAFCGSNIVAVCIPVLKDLEKRDWTKIGVVLAVLLVLSFVPLPFNEKQTALPIAAVLMFVACCGLVVAHERLRFTSRAFCGALACLVIVSSGVTALFLTSEGVGRNYQSEFLSPVGSSYERFTSESPYAVVDQLPDLERDQYRYSMLTNYGRENQNNSLVSNRMGLESFHSHYIQSIDDYRNELGIPDTFYRSYYFGSDGRLALDALSAAKYLVASKKLSWLVPATYESTGMKQNGNTLYSTDYSLPLAFSCGEVLPRSIYEELDAAQKQDALVQACVLKDSSIADGSDVLDDVDVSVVTKGVEIEAGEGIEFRDGAIDVSKAGATVKLTFDPQAQAETYLVIENLRLDDDSLNGRETFGLNVSCKNGDRKYTPRTKLAAQTYSGKTSWICNMGYSDKGISWIQMEFPEKGTYLYDGLRVECQPIEPIKEGLSALQGHALGDIQKTNHSISGTASTEMPVEYAVFMLSYSRGWSATVDGQAAEVLRADTGFMAVPVRGAGDHEVVLTYETPGLRIGMAMSAIGLVGLVVLAFVRRARRSHDERVA